jgi:CubicO group peptidase (beta-lactamase class C family)
VGGLAAVLVAAGAVAGQGTTYDEKVAETDVLFASWAGTDSPGCSVGIILDGDLIFTRGYGSANLDYGVPLEESSVFYIASTSKQFTAAAIARLALDGRLSLDDEVQDYIPELPRYEWPVRIRHLVHHTSGLRDYLTLMTLAGQSFEDYWDNASGLVLLERQKALNFEPGSEFLYSNSGYIVLAEIVERVTGQTLQEYTWEEFFSPLEMSATQWGEDLAAVIPNRVVSYSPRDGGTLRTWLKNFHGKGDGNLLTTVENLAQWDRIFYEDSGNWAELTDLTLTRGTLNDGTAQDYAFGLGHGEYRDLETVSHGGGMLGFRTQFLRFPRERFSVICLCNLGSINASRLSNRLADIWLFESDAPPAEGQPRESADEESPSWDPGADELGRFVGSYLSEELDVTYEVELRDGALYVTHPNDSTELTALEPGVFRLDPRGFVRLAFDDGDPARGFTLSAGRVRGLGFVRR